MAVLVLKVYGMDCPDEVALLRRALQPLLQHPDRIQFDLLHGKLTLELEGEETTPEAVLEAVRRAGLRAVHWEAFVSRSQQHDGFWVRSGRQLASAISGVALLMAFAAHAWHEGWWGALTAGEISETGYPSTAAALYLISIISGAWHFAPKGLAALKRLRPDINLLVVIAIVGAGLLGNWFEGAMVSFLFSIALLLESWSVGRARRAITALLELAPARARYVCPCDGNLMEKPVEEVPLHATVLVRPGERVPLDGQVTKGVTSVNQAPITGESTPVPKGAGDSVYAGTINNEGAFEFTVTRAAADTTLARIIRLVEDAQARRAPTEQFVDTFARYYTPLMMLLALLIFTAQPLLFGAAWHDGFYNALVMLLIACPCALVISTPVSVVAGLATAARAGVLIKGGAYLELPGRLKVLALDKTGTLTTGAPKVQQVTPLNGHSAAELIAMAAGIEQHSGHPLAQAIVRHAEETGVALAPAEGYQELPGKGAEAQIRGARYWIGSQRLLHEKGRESSLDTEVSERLQDAGHSIVMLGSEEACQPAGASQPAEAHICGIISIADAIRPTAAEAVAALRGSRIREIIMLTGDNTGTAHSIAEAAGVTGFEAELLPEDKVRAIERLKREYGLTGMVGDGVNDAPAMAVADIGIAMGAVGSDAAIETADIALMSDDLSKLPWLVRHSRRTLRVIMQNIVIAISLKAAVMLLALLGLATLWMAVAADMGASLLVITNALRLLRPTA